ncbi:T22C5.5 [Arabidopsis thaliana]|uniref:T22C5.5 n=1 Tax=Arabidopsis thaliana TaxID=3702 RepID=Q9SFZ6_ARATH|nr:uncharacterized protein AT1G27610 [Arabidopsis thaliana]AAF24964.1 T22C5.5 [Arabidopsis thaliana]AEE30854.1 hypothetical protein AT1G27610 [Arabidopsis thaliana]|eukprot:NP_174082.1 hypothetical protein AT1G27610 [Arabidopsis thaliana]
MLVGASSFKATINQKKIPTNPSPLRMRSGSARNSTKKKKILRSSSSFSRYASEYLGFVHPSRLIRRMETKNSIFITFIYNPSLMTGSWTNYLRSPPMKGLCYFGFLFCKSLQFS